MKQDVVMTSLASLFERHQQDVWAIDDGCSCCGPYVERDNSCSCGWRPTANGGPATFAEHMAEMTTDWHRFNA